MNHVLSDHREGPVRARVTASIAVSAIVAVALAGCAFLTPQATLKHYDPSDGVSASIGDVRISNALVLTDDGKDGNLILSALNTSSRDLKLNVQWDAAGTKTTVTVKLPAGKATQIGYGDDGQEYLADIGTDAGGLLPVYFQYGDVAGKQLQLPVLDGTLPQYTELLPTPTPTPTLTPNPIASGEPDPNATPTPSATP
jgi:hypothetical protein